MKYFLLLLTCIVVIGCTKKTEDPLKQVAEIDISVPTVKCEMCEKTIKDAAYALAGVKAVDVDLEKKNVHIKYIAMQTNLETMEMAIADAGYDAGTRKRNPEAYENLPACCKND